MCMCKLDSLALPSVKNKEILATPVEDLIHASVLPCPTTKSNSVPHKPIPTPSGSTNLLHQFYHLNQHSVEKFCSCLLNFTSASSGVFYPLHPELVSAFAIWCFFTPLRLGIGGKGSPHVWVDSFRAGVTFVAGMLQISPMPSLSSTLFPFPCLICCSASCLIFHSAVCPIPNRPYVTQGLPMPLLTHILQVGCPWQINEHIILS